MAPSWFLAVVFVAGMTLGPSAVQSWSPVACMDRHERCGEWAKEGECKANPVYMLDKCRLSCGVCRPIPKCGDSDPRCKQWAARGDCDTRDEFMYNTCKRSCHHCPVYK